MTAQAPLPVPPAGSAIPVSAAVDLFVDDDGGRVFIYGALAFAWDGGDKVARRLAAVQLVRIDAATQVQVATAFGVNTSTVYRWSRQLADEGAAGLLAERTGPQGPSKLSESVVARIVALRGEGYSMRVIATRVGVAHSSIGRALSEASDGSTDDSGADADDSVLPVLPDRLDRTGERALARAGLLTEAAPVFTAAARVPLAGLLLAIPALAATGLLDSARQVYGRLPKGFYGLDTTLTEAVLRTLAGEPRAEGATRINPTDLGRVLGMDRGPEVTTIRRKLAHLAGRTLAADLLEAQARRHLANHTDAAAVLYVDGHVRTYHGKRKIQKTHAARLRFPAPATTETWLCDGSGAPVWMVMAEPGASLASELSRLVPEIRTLVGDDRRVLVGFDRGGWSPGLFADMIAAGFDVLTWRKHRPPDLEEGAFSAGTLADDTPVKLADQCLYLPIGTSTTQPQRVGLRQVSKLDADAGTQAHILTSRHDLTAAQVVELMSARWRHENYFRYGRMHLALDAHDSYAATDDDPGRLVPNPAKERTRGAVRAARARLDREDAHADARLLEAATPAPGTSSTIVTSSIQNQIVAPVLEAEDALDAAQDENRATPTHLPLEDVRPGQQVLDTETKLITHAIRMAAFNIQDALARSIRTATGYSHAHNEAHTLIRTALKSSGDIDPRDGVLHVRLDPLGTPRATAALAELCDHLNQTKTSFPGTDLDMVYSVKPHK